MGMTAVLVGYLLIACLTAFGFYYKDYRDVVNAHWCENPAKFANEFMGFHFLLGAMWPLVLLAAVVVIPFYLIGKTFGFLCNATSKRVKHEKGHQ